MTHGHLINPFLFGVNLQLKSTDHAAPIDSFYTVSTPARIKYIVCRSACLPLRCRSRDHNPNEARYYSRLPFAVESALGREADRGYWPLPSGSACRRRLEARSLRRRDGFGFRPPEVFTAATKRRSEIARAIRPRRRARARAFAHIRNKFLTKTGSRPIVCGWQNQRVRLRAARLR